MFSKAEFQTWARANVVLFASVATKIEGRTDDTLLQDYGFRSFPSMAILDGEGTTLTKGFNRSLYAIRNVVRYGLHYERLKARIGHRQEVDQIEWLLARLGNGKLTAPEAKKALAEMQLDAMQAKAVKQFLFVEEMTALSNSERTDGRDPSPRASDAVYEAFKEGKRVPSDAPPSRFFDRTLIHAATKNRDAMAFFFAHDRVRAGIMAKLKIYEARIATMKGRRERFKDDADMLRRVERTAQRVKQMSETAKKQLADLEATANALKAAGK